MIRGFYFEFERSNGFSLLKEKGWVMTHSDLSKG